MGAQWLPRRALERLALRRFANMVRHAAKHVPYYREEFRAAGVQPGSLRRRDDLAQVPLLDKSVLRDRHQDLLADDAPPTSVLSRRSSSGSTGIPVRVLFDPLRDLPRRAQELRLLTAHGLRPWDRQLIFDHPGHLTDSPFLIQRLGLWRRQPYPWQLEIDAGVALIEAERPEVLHGVLSSLRLLALAVQARGGLSYRPRLCVSKGELLDAATRTLIEKALRAPLVDYYATEEVGIVAWQSPTDEGYLIDEDMVLLEVVDGAGTPLPAGETGEIVVTNLYQRSMPVIRYRTGDLGVISPRPSSSGRGLPVLTRLLGRRVDCIVTSSGEAHHPFALLGVMEDRAELLSYRIVQQAMDEIVVQLAFRPEVDAAQRHAVQLEVAAAMQGRLGPDMRVRFESTAPTDLPVGDKHALVVGLPDAALPELVKRKLRVRL
jgi:phenylacetate-CoA ligase